MSQADGHPRRVRVLPVDALRAVAIFAVILIHTKPFLSPAQDFGPWGYVGVVLDQLTRFAVPFFFVIAGYFFAEKMRRDGIVGALRRYAWRIYAAFLFWSLIYLVLPRFDRVLLLGYGTAVLQRLQSMDLVDILVKGPAPHLWFLPTLVLAVAALALVRRFRLERWALPLAAITYLGALAAGPYSVVFLGEDTGLRRGLAFGLLPATIGYLAAVRHRGFRLGRGALLLAAGYGLHFLEAYALWRWLGLYPLEMDNLLGTALIAAGVFELAMAAHDLPLSERLAHVGRFTLGIYAGHLLFVGLLEPLDHRIGSLLWEPVFPCAVFLLSLGLSVALYQVPPLRRFVH